MEHKEVLLTQDSIDFIHNLIEDRQDALNVAKNLPTLSRATAQHEIDVVLAALRNATVF